MLDVEWLIKSGPCKKYLAGQLIPCSTGASLDERSMYIIVTGRVIMCIESGEDHALSAVTLCPGDAFGGREFFCCVGGNTYIADVDTIVCEITENSFRQLAQNKPDVLFEVLRAAYAPPGSAPAPSLQSLAKAKKNPGKGISEKPETEKPEKSAVENTEKSAAGQGNTTVKTAESPVVQEQTAAAEPDSDEPPLPIHSAVEIAAEGVFPPGHKSYPDAPKTDCSKILIEKEYVCPCCKKKFKDYKVLRSKLHQSGAVRFDMRKYYHDFQAEWYDVITCQHCLFSMYHTYFTEPKPLLKQKIEESLVNARSNMALDFSKERNVDYVFASHYLALLCAPGYVSTGRQVVAKLWGNISWLYEDMGDTEMAAYAAGETASAYERLYSETPLTPTQEQVTCLSIAGMLYRAGKHQNLKKYLFTAKTLKTGDRSYSRMAEDFIEKLREEAVSVE